MDGHIVSVGDRRHNDFFQSVYKGSTFICSRYSGIKWVQTLMAQWYHGGGGGTDLFGGWNARELGHLVRVECEKGRITFW